MHSSLVPQSLPPRNWSNTIAKPVRDTVKLENERYDYHTKPRSGRPKKWDDKFERRVLRIARINPKMTYKDIKVILDIHLSYDTLSRILKNNGLTNQLTKCRPYLTVAAVMKRYQ